jgi:hypothetical protein
LRKTEKSKMHLKSFREKNKKGAIINNATPQLKIENESFTSSNHDSCKAKTNKLKFDHSVQTSLDNIFPPDPLDRKLAHLIIKSACDAMEPHQIEEAGCAVCGQLVLKSMLSRLSAVTNFLHILACPGVTRKERLTRKDMISEYSIVLDDSCDQICNDCWASLHKNKIPKYALAKGLWIGQVPEVLSSLHFVEHMLIARVRHSCCCIKIASGMHKMKANVIAFQSPILKVYDILPPPKKDLEDVLAIMFTGPNQPTPSDFQRTPFLV